MAGGIFVMAGIIASVCLLGCAFDPNAPTNPAERDLHREFEQGDKKKKHLSRNPSYLLLVFVTTIVILGNSAIFLLKDCTPEKLCHKNPE